MEQLQNGRPIRLGLENTNGYNPLQLQHYVDYVTAMNGRVQNYHFSNVMYSGLNSPLLDMLGVRYIIVDARIPPERDDYLAIASRNTEVFRNQWVVVFENPRAFLRAWIVHRLRQNNDGDGLALLASGQIDGRTTAVIDGAMSPIRQAGTIRGQTPQQVTGSTATVTDRSPDSMTIRADAVEDGLLVVSEIYEQGWVAYVDGEPVEIVRTNQAFRGVPLTAGEHIVEFRYESQPLTIGLWISGTALVGMLASDRLADMERATALAAANEAAASLVEVNLGGIDRRNRVHWHRVVSRPADENGAHRTDPSRRGGFAHRAHGATSGETVVWITHIRFMRRRNHRDG